MQAFLLFVPVLLFSFIAHEYAHGYAALKQGDNTALVAGRLTWNPIKHIDLWMTILLPLLLWRVSGGTIILGGAKPVPVNPANYRNYRRGDIIVSLAGVVTNFLIAISCTALIALLGFVGRADALASTAGILQAMMVDGVRLNMLLVAFNLLPVPPLDGSHVLKHFLPATWALHYQRAGLVGLGIVVLMLYLAPQLLTYWLKPANVFGRELLNVVQPTVLPSATRWLQ